MSNRMSELIDLFSNLTASAYAKLFYAKRREREAEARYRQLLGEHKLILQDPRYQRMAQDSEAVLGEQLTRLVEKASGCAHCAPIAERIKLLQEIVGEPVQMIWIEAHRPKDEVERTELAPTNGSE